MKNDIINKDVLDNGFSIHKKKDSYFYTFDTVHTLEMNKIIKNGNLLPELIMVGTPVREAYLVIQRLAMTIFKMGVYNKQFILTDVDSFYNVKFLFIEVSDLELAKKEMINIEEKIQKIEKIYQVIASDAYGNFFTDDDSYPLFFNKDNIDLSAVIKLKSPTTNKVEHKMLYKMHSKMNSLNN